MQPIWIVFGIAYLISFFAAETSLLLAPFLFGIPHLMTSARLSAQTISLENRFVIFFGLVFIAVFIFIGHHNNFWVWGESFLTKTEVIAVLLVAALFFRNSHSFGVLLVAAVLLLCFYASLKTTVYTLAIAHNFVAFIYWSKYFRAKKTSHKQIGIYSVVFAILTLTFWGRFEAALAFGQLVHYYIWLVTIRGVTFHFRWFPVVGLAGSALLFAIYFWNQAEVARQIYIHVAAAHGYWEILGLPLFLKGWRRLQSV